MTPRPTLGSFARWVTAVAALAGADVALDRSRDVWSTDTGHPAYERILTELAPDEARILMLSTNNILKPAYFCHSETLRTRIYYFH
mgnify:CR=1 FL=1